MKLAYLDLDGVLLGKDGKADPGFARVALAAKAEEFLAFCVAHYECYWLTTHCRHGDATHVMNVLGRYAGDAVMKLAAAIGPTAWKTLKTEAFDLSSDFFWIDDAPLQAEIDFLEKRGLLDRWINVDTRRNTDDLLRVMGILREALD